MAANILQHHAREEESMRTTFTATAAAALMLASSNTVPAQTDDDQQLGTVHLQTSCNELAQRRIDRAMRYQHSYWYVPAKEVFEEALKADPTCGMALWGVALTLLDNP